MASPMTPTLSFPAFPTVVPAINFTHPERLFVNALASGSISNINVTTANAATAANFFTDLTNNGASVDSNFTASVAKQIVSLTGKGEIIYVIGPTATGSATTQFIFVLDGTTYTSPAFAVAAGERACLTISGTQTAVYTTASAGPAGGVLDSTKVWNTTTIQLPGWLSPLAWSVPRLQFSSSCVFSINHSENISGTAAQERQSGICYRMLATYT